MYKGKDNRLHMGPLWDFDLAFGNLSFLWDMQYTSKWTFHNRLYIKPLFWYKYLLQNHQFTTQLRARYFALRQEGMPLDINIINNDIDMLIHEMGAAPQRNYQRWYDTYRFSERNILNTKLRSKAPQENLRILRQWLWKRVSWLDRNFQML